MKILVTGAYGFAGSHLLELLRSKKHEIYPPHVDLLNATDVAAHIGNKQFDGVIHLAAIASAGDSFNSPGKILRNNILAELNLLEALRARQSKARILILGSADEYGRGSSKPVHERTPLLPISPYAVSKIGQDFLALQYHLAYGMAIIRVRPFNHIGERQALGFVVPDFAKQIVDIEKSGKPGVMNVGNLEPVRDFTDVKDMVRAYEVALEKGIPGEVYNIGSGKGVKIRNLLNRMIHLSTARITIHVDQSRLRPDEPRLVCDPKKFQKLTGWEAQIPLEETLRRVLKYWRNESKDPTVRMV